MTRTLLIAGLVLVAGACSNPSGPLDKLKLEVALSRSTLETGDTLIVTVRAINRTPEIVRVSGSSTCLLSTEVRDAEGIQVSPGVLCTADLSEHRIAAYDTLVAVRRWVAQGPPVYGVHPPIEPGRYAVVGELRAAEGTLTRSVAVQVVPR